MVCTGNICRSALAERLGRAYLDDVLREDAGAIMLQSAGIRAVVDSAMHPHSALVLQSLGGDPRGFRARQLLDGMVRDADLILTMNRQHRRAVLFRVPWARARTFTLLEAADLVERLGDDVDLDGETLHERASSLVARMAAARGQRSASGKDDIRDPIGLSAEVHTEVGEAIAGALVRVLARIACARDAGRRLHDCLRSSADDRNVRQTARGVGADEGVPGQRVAREPHSK